MATELPLANIGIAVTRPTQQAKKLIQLIEAAGGSVIAFPLIDIVPLQDYALFENTISQLSQYDWIIFISSNAVQNGMPRLIEKGIPSTLHFAAIGPVTAQELNQFGINQVLIPSDGRFDSESLLSMPELQSMQGKKVMIVRGIGGRDVLANTLINRGAQVTFAECYQRVNPQKNDDVLTQAYAKQALQGIVVTSSEAMRHLLDLAGKADWLRQITLYVNHARIAEQPLQMGLKVQVAEAPGDSAMMTCLCSHNSL
jgi:uroporphyrinogen-III synthase